MPPLTCYRLRREVDGHRVQGFDDFLDREGLSITEHGPLPGPDFEAMLYVSTRSPASPKWTTFLREGFADLAIPLVAGVSALLLVRVRLRRGGSWEYFALTFGPGGRFLLKEGTYERGYGLRTALNLVYPREQSQEGPDLARLISLDAKRRSPDSLRSRRQTGRSAAFEAFDLDRLRDIVSAATGRPTDVGNWGTRISGGDALNLQLELGFEQLGRMCKRIAVAHDRTDYQERFAWLDDMQPVVEPGVRDSLESRIVEALREQRTDEFGLGLGPPEIIDWTRVVSFRFDFDRRQDVRHRELRLRDYLAGLRQRDKLEELDAAFLRNHHVAAIDSDGTEIHRWSIWRCLLGELHLDDVTYVLDEGDLFAIAKDYLEALDAYIRNLPETKISLPSSPHGMHERTYNEYAVDKASDLLLLDRRTIVAATHTTPVEICDILSRERQLIHVKRKLGSRDLSHLFAQGVVSAELLQMDPDARNAAQTVISRLPGGGAFTFFEPAGIVTGDFEITYAIIAAWRSRDLAEALPFFSKINLRRAVSDLVGRGFSVTCARIGVES